AATRYSRREAACGRRHRARRRLPATPYPTLCCTPVRSRADAWRMRSAECGMRNHGERGWLSALPRRPIPHSAFRTPHSPLALFAALPEHAAELGELDLL